MAVVSRIKNFIVAGLEVVFGVIMFVFFNPYIQGLVNNTSSSAAKTFGTAFPFLWFGLVFVGAILTMMGLDLSESKSSGF